MHNQNSKMPSPARSEELKAITASVFYLEREAQRAGLNDISSILKKGLAEIDAWIKGNACNDIDYKYLIDSDLYRILLLLDKFGKQNRFDIQQALNAIEKYENIKRCAN